VFDVEVEAITILMPAFNILLSHTDGTRWRLRQKVTQNVTSAVA